MTLLTAGYVVTLALAMVLFICTLFNFWPGVVNIPEQPRRWNGRSFFRFARIS